MDQSPLYDRLGGYEEAIETAREIADISASDATNLVIFPKAQTFFELIFSDQGFVHVSDLFRTKSPEQTISAALEEMTRPGAWVLAPSLRIE